MTATIEAKPESDAGSRTLEPRLGLDVVTGQRACVVHVTGELDLATRDQFVSASTAGRRPEVMIDLGGVTFMDCSGYSALSTARRIVEGQGRSLTVSGQTGQPARLLELIAQLEQGPLRPAPKIGSSVA